MARFRIYFGNPPPSTLRRVSPSTVPSGSSIGQPTVTRLQVAQVLPYTVDSGAVVNQPTIVFIAPTDVFPATVVNVSVVGAPTIVAYSIPFQVLTRTVVTKAAGSGTRISGYNGAVDRPYTESVEQPQLSITV
jgi:hypothetical protein